MSCSIAAAPVWPSKLATGKLKAAASPVASEAAPLTLRLTAAMLQSVWYAVKPCIQACLYTERCEQDCVPETVMCARSPKPGTAAGR